jgi:glyoxylase I family protein
MEVLMITGIHHVSLKCNGMEQFNKTVDFYTNLLGLKVLRQWGEGDDSAVMLEIGGNILEIFATGQSGDQTGSINHFAFYTDDPAAWIEKVRAAGYLITQEPKKMDVTLTGANAGEPYPLFVAFCVGPIGEEIEFFSECK